MLLEIFLKESVDIRLCFFYYTNVLREKAPIEILHKSHKSSERNLK